MPMFLGMGGRTSVARMLAKECAVVLLLEDKLEKETIGLQARGEY